MLPYRLDYIFTLRSGEWHFGSLDPTSLSRIVSERYLVGVTKSSLLIVLFRSFQQFTTDLYLRSLLSHPSVSRCLSVKVGSNSSLCHVRHLACLVLKKNSKVSCCSWFHFLDANTDFRDVAPLFYALYSVGVVSSYTVCSTAIHFCID